MNFSKGAKVRLSEFARKQMPSRKIRDGIVVGFSRDKTCVRVRWDGTNTSESIHPDFLEEIYQKAGRIGPWERPE
jgi:hypothetical protein